MLGFILLIEGIRWLLDKIKKIENRRERKYAMARLRSILYRRRNLKYKTMSSAERLELEKQLDQLRSEVDEILSKQGSK